MGERSFRPASPRSFSKEEMMLDKIHKSDSKKVGFKLKHEDKNRNDHRHLPPSSDPLSQIVHADKSDGASASDDSLVDVAFSGPIPPQRRSRSHSHSGNEQRSQEDQARVFNQQGAHKNKDETKTTATTKSKENTYSFIPKSEDVLDSPASKHIISQFEKFLAKEIMANRQSSQNQNQNHVADPKPETSHTTSTPKPALKKLPFGVNHEEMTSGREGEKTTSGTFNYNPNDQESSIFIKEAPANRQFSKTISTTSNISATTDNTEHAAHGRTRVWANPSTTSTSTNGTGFDTPKILAKGTVKCRFSYSGCKEILEKGSIQEQDHYISCKFRPVQCILTPSCTEIIPYHDYIPHLMNHYLVPTYANEISCSVVLTKADFDKNQKFRPKWFSAYGLHFFAMISRTAAGIWSAWVWLLGSKEEADNFAARIEFFKGLKNISELFPCHSIRVSQEEIEEERTCLLVKDETMCKLTNLQENVLADFSLRVKLIPHAKELNNTTRQLRNLEPRFSRRLESEKYYVTTINLNEDEDEEEEDEET